MSKAIWIDDDNCDFPFDSDDVGFLVSRENELKGRPTYYLLVHPARSNQSGTPTLDGWCGTWNNTRTEAHGLARVARRAKNGRLCLARVPATAGLLDELGYPELADELEEPIESEMSRRDRWHSMLVSMGITLIHGESNALSGPALDRAYAATVAMLG